MEKRINQSEVQNFSNLELLARQVVEGFITGLHKSPFHGFSVEFAEHRLYNTGESIKHIDWKLFGRSEKLFVKRYEEETNLRCQLIIDNSSSMHFPEISKQENKMNKITFSAHCAAALMYLLQKQRDAVGLSVFSDKVEINTQARSNTRHMKLMFHALDAILFSPANNLNTKTAVSAALHQIAENIHKRSLVIIFSDMMENSAASEELFGALQHLRHNRHEVILFHVVDKQKEIDFNFENRPYIFIDLETGEQLKVQANKVREQYLENMAKFKKELMLKCGQYKIEFVEADINQGYKQVLLPYLVKRSKMH